MKCDFDISMASTITVSAEKYMYGIVYVWLTHQGTNVIVSYAAIADGGEVCGEGTTVYENKTLTPILHHILETEYSEEEDCEASYSWGIQIGDDNDNIISEVERAYWGEDSILSLLSCIEKEIGGSEALRSLRTLVEF